jgi:hypothetical protein
MYKTGSQCPTKVFLVVIVIGMLEAFKGENVVVQNSKKHIRIKKQ